MIAKLRGIVDGIGEDSAVLDVNGVGYLLFASSRTLSKLIVGAEASLFTEMVVREDNISLYGFGERMEKEWFLTLTKVQGVGAKVGLAILSVLTPLQIAQGIASQDKAVFTRANGVGPKLAARIVVELKDKIVSLPVSAGASEFASELKIDPAAGVNSKIEDAISALVNLGYQRVEAYRAVTAAASGEPDADVGKLIKLALREFAGGEA